MQSAIEIIQARQAEILAEWARTMRHLPAARDLSHAALLDRFPQLLEEILANVKDLADHKLVASFTDNTPELHALDRLETSFDIRHVVTEYAVLRDCIFRVLGSQTSVVDPESLRLLNQAIDHAIFISTDRFTRARDRTLQALDRISVAALESQELGDFLQELLRVLVDTTPAIDTAVILLREGDELRVRATVGLEEATATDVSIKIGEGFAGTIAAERRPRLLDTNSPEPLVQSAMLHGKELQALYGVPLVDAGEVVGVAQIGSSTAHEFSTQDKNLIMALAHRATAGISQHILREKLTRAVTTRDNVLAVVSHDLRSPLNVIQMSAAVTLLQTSPGQEGERARSSAERIIRSAQRMTSLIKDLLDVSSIEAGHLAVDLREHALEIILSDALEVNLPLAAEKSVRLLREGEMLLTQVRCDRERILQVLTNLVGNAIKFTPEGGFISVGAQVEGDRVVLAVRDTGSGIAEGDLPHLFEPYWQSKPLADRKTGIGLGLAICKGIVEAHGGAIWAHSKEGEGSSFYFALPLAGGTRPHKED